jgi:hypothetical protein
MSTIGYCSIRETLTIVAREAIAQTKGVASCQNRDGSDVKLKNELQHTVYQYFIIKFK